MTKLTSLPLPLLSRILSHLCDEAALNARAELRLTRDYIPNRHPPVSLTLFGVQNVNAPFPSELLAPALASPVLAAAAQHFLRGRLSYLTDVNTAARLATWMHAFSEFVEAVVIVDAGEKWRRKLSRGVRKGVEERLRREAVELCRTIFVRRVRLKVLDLVNVPFDVCGDMQDELMTALCMALEMCQSTLKELALPVYVKSDLCTRALAMVTLPHLSVLSIELKIRRIPQGQWPDANPIGGKKCLDMMRAVDGHADRLKGLTTLQELRLVNLYCMPCTAVKESGCSAGFFRAIKTLRITVDYSSLFGHPDHEEGLFCSLFRELECFYRAGSSSSGISNLVFGKRLKEAHFCHHVSRTGEPVEFDECTWTTPGSIVDVIYIGHRETRTLVVDALDSWEIRTIYILCPNLQHLSLPLQVTAEHIREFGKLLKKCSRLTELRIFVNGDEYDEIGETTSKQLLKVGRMIPGRTKLRKLAIQIGLRRGSNRVPMDELVECLLGIIKRTGGSLEKLCVRLGAKHKTATHSFDALCRIMDCCADHSRVLTHLDIDTSPLGVKLNGLPRNDFFDACDRLRLCKEKLIESQPRLNKIDLGCWHCFLDADISSCMSEIEV